MPLFLCKWKIRDAGRSDTLTLFASMNPETDAKDAGEGNTLIARWSSLGNATGMLICQSTDVLSLSKWLYNWSEDACDCEVTPIVDDDAAREIILASQGLKPTWKADYYKKIGDKGYECAKGESIFILEYQFVKKDAMDGYKMFAGMTKEADSKDSGKVVPLGRWHNLGAGCGVAVCKLPVGATEVDLYKWAFNWAGICDIRISAALTDNAGREVIKAKPGFDAKLAAVMKKMGMA
jgi:hypothetical protein